MKLKHLILFIVTSVIVLQVNLLVPGAAAQNIFRLVWDDFQNGFSIGTNDAKWFYFSAGSYVGDDGIVTTNKDGLRVISSGENPNTGEPAFVRTIGQEKDNDLELQGDLDHVKWAVFMNHTASSGFSGFDAIPGQELSCETTISGQSFGNAGHPFGTAVKNPNDDLRLGSVVMNTIDFDTSMVFDFFLTNERIYAFYERLSFARDRYGNYAAFSFAIPVGLRTPTDKHNLKIAYNKAAGTVRWLVNNTEVYRVTRIGHLINRRYMTIDHGGIEATVSPNQLNCGMGMFTLLDGHKPSNIGLVRLSSLPNFYFNPKVGAPEAEMFVDNDSLPSNRLFGQGAELRIRKYVVSSAVAR